MGSQPTYQVPIRAAVEAILSSVASVSAHEITTFRATPGEVVDGGRRYVSAITLDQPGSAGVTCRVVPNRAGLATTAELGLAALSTD